MLSWFIYSRASDFGLMKIDHTGRIIQFAEKPKGSDLNAMVLKSPKASCHIALHLITSFPNLHNYKYNISNFRLKLVVNLSYFPTSSDKRHDIVLQCHFYISLVINFLFIIAYGI